jgi:hypothetical protein
LKKQSQQRSSKQKTVANRAADSHSKRERFNIPPAVLQKIAFCIIGTAVVLSWFMTPIPIAVGFTIVAVIRVGVAVREARKEAANQDGERCDKSRVCSV